MRRRRWEEDARVRGRQGTVVLGAAGIMRVGGCSGSTCHRGFLQRGVMDWSVTTRQRLASLGEGLGSRVGERYGKDHITHADRGSVMCDGNHTYQRGLVTE
jgi:hypothetical protein